MLKTALGHRAEIFTELSSTVLKRFSLLFQLCICYGKAMWSSSLFLDKYVKVISAMYKNNTAAVKVGNEVSCWFRMESGVEQDCVLFPFI